MNSTRDRLPATITTDRLMLTTPTLAHVPEMAVLANSKAIHQVLSRLPHPYDESHGRFFVEHLARGPEEFAWSILLQGQYVGTMGLHLLPDLLPELGYWLGEPFWGRGIMTAVVRAVTNHALTAPGFLRLEAPVFAWNPASMRVLEKCGYVREGVLRKSVFKDGEVIDSVLYAKVVP